LAMMIVGLSFVALSRRTAHAGSAYAYVSHSFRHRCGFFCRLNIGADLSGLCRRPQRSDGKSSPGRCAELWHACAVARVWSRVNPRRRLLRISRHADCRTTVAGARRPVDTGDPRAELGHHCHTAVSHAGRRPARARTATRLAGPRFR
jgi:hypothetical protein